MRRARRVQRAPPEQPARQASGVQPARPDPRARPVPAASQARPAPGSNRRRRSEREQPGPTGASGKAGATGPAGAPGSAGSEPAYSATASGVSKQAETLTLTAPAGRNYIATANAEGTVGSSSHPLTCTLFFGTLSSSRLSCPTTRPPRRSASKAPAHSRAARSPSPAPAQAPGHASQSQPHRVRRLSRQLTSARELRSEILVSRRS